MPARGSSGSRRVAANYLTQATDGRRCRLVGREAIDVLHAGNGGSGQLRPGWMAESGVPAEVAGTCLAHLPKSRVVQAYQRSDLLERHADVLQVWSHYVTKR